MPKIIIIVYNGSILFVYVSILLFSVLNSANDQNSTKVNSSECGFNYCDFRESTTVVYDIKPIEDETQITILACIYLVCSVFALILVASFLDPLSRYKYYL